jgi:hypothetical protein
MHHPNQNQWSPEHWAVLILLQLSGVTRVDMGLGKIFPISVLVGITKVLNMSPTIHGNKERLLE